MMMTTEILKQVRPSQDSEGQPVMIVPKPIWDVLVVGVSVPVAQQRERILALLNGWLDESPLPLPTPKKQVRGGLKGVSRSKR